MWPELMARWELHGYPVDPGHRTLLIHSETIVLKHQQGCKTNFDPWTRKSDGVTKCRCLVSFLGVSVLADSS